MSSKNETPILIASLLVTMGLLGGGYWWFTQSNNVDLSSLPGLGGGSPSGTSTPGSGTVSGTTAERFADIEEVPSGLFNYGGSTTWAPIRGMVDPVIQQAHPAFQLRYVSPIGAPPGSGTGIEMLLNNQLSFSQSSRPLNPEERQRAEQQGYSLTEIPVALEGLAIAVNPDLAVDGLTLTQLRNIYLGTVTNWREVGGPNVDITPVSRPLEGGTVEFFIETVLGNSPLSQEITIIDTTTEALRFVGNTPGAIYYASAPEVVGQCSVKPIAVGREGEPMVKPYVEPYVSPADCPDQRNQINRDALRTGNYPLTRRLFVIVREDGQIDQRAGETYAELLLTQEGQTLLNQAGFVSIR